MNPSTLPAGDVPSSGDGDEDAAPAPSISKVLAPPPGLEPAALALWTAIHAQRNLLGSEFVDALLLEPKHPISEEVPVTPDEVPRPWLGVAKGALYKTLLQELLLWGGSGIFPLTFATGPLLPCCTTNAEGELMNEIAEKDSGNPMFRTLAVARAARERSAEAFEAALMRIGISGVARLLGCRVTAGSVSDALPPLRERLIEAAATRVGRKRGAKISVAAKALMKHCGRRGEGWGTCYWGREEVVMYGGDEEKNERAAAVVERVLDQCVWMNLHHAPGGTRVLELRVESGHGVRWHAMDGVFRGFLEPHSKEIAMLRKEERKAKEREKESASGEGSEEGEKEGVVVDSKEVVEKCEGDSDPEPRKIGAKVAQAMAIFSV